LSATKPAVARRRSKAEKAEKALLAKRSHSSPGEGRLSLPAAEGDDKNEHGAVSSDGVAKADASRVAGEIADEPEHKVDPVMKLQDNWHEDSVLTSHDDAEGGLVRTPGGYDCSTSLAGPAAKEESVRVNPVREAIWRPFFRDARHEWGRFLREHADHWNRLIAQRNRCLGALLVMCIYCGLGGMLFRFTEGAFEAFYKCGVKRVKRDFVDSLWLGSQHLLEDEWKSQARRKLMELETQLHAAHDAGVTTYSGQRSWSFLNAVLYCLTVVTTIGKVRTKHALQATINSRKLVLEGKSWEHISCICGGGGGVSHRFPTAAARVRSCRIFCGQNGTGAGFLRVLQFPLPILIPPTAPHSSSIIRAGTIRQTVADVPSGLSLTAHPKKVEKWWGDSMILL
jgi:hypothetical protein